jgi:hypothetical protein
MQIRSGHLIRKAIRYIFKNYTLCEIFFSKARIALFYGTEGVEAQVGADLIVSANVLGMFR